MLRLEDVHLTVGNKELLAGAELHVRPGDKVGIVGANGAGKSSLLRLMLGELEPEAGRVHRRGGIHLGHLPQQAVDGSTDTVWDEAARHMHRIQRLQADIDRSQAQVEQGVDGAVERLGDATEAFRIAGGYAVDQRIGEVLHGLGFGPDTWTRTVDTFSGGWQMRVALARLLLSDPDVLVLDEPTNHLDLRARSWLARHLAGHDGTVVVVSHDRHLLDTATTVTAEVRHKRLTVFRGNLTAWLAERAQREASLESAVATQQAERAKLERFVERFGAKATKAAAAKSKQKALDRMDVLQGPERDSRPRLRLPEAPGCSREAIVLHDAAVGWVPETPVVSGASMVLERGMRVAVLGPNGTGKSTLLHALAGTLPLQAGRRRVGKDVRVGVFRQDLAAELPDDATALELVQRAAPSVLPERARAALGALGLSGDAALRPIGSLSGGEKARVVLAGFALQPFNVLLLDEPTNHLDVVTVDVLTEALEAWEGALFFVTHDRFLVERLATHVATVADGAMEIHEGIRPEDLDPVDVRGPAGADDEGPTEGALSHEARKARHKERRAHQRRFEQLSKAMERLTGELESLDAQLVEHATDFEKASALGARHGEVEAELEAVFEELAEVEEALADD